MSSTDIYGFRKTDNCAELCASIPNAWRGAMAIWSALEEKYLPPYIPDHVKFCNWYRPDMSFDEIVQRNGYKPTRCNTITLNPKDSPIHDVWNLTYSFDLTKEDRIALYSTFDRILVSADYTPEVIAAFRASKLEGTSLSEQADVLENLLKSGEYIAFGWGNSTSPHQWDSYAQAQDGTDIPYNCKTGKDHWWISEYTCRVPFGEIPQEGDLYISRVYLFYEEPQIFSCVNTEGQMYLVIAIPKDGLSADNAWLLLPISETRLSQAERHEIDTRALFLRPESRLLLALKNGETFAAKHIRPEQLTDNILPQDGEFL